MSEAQNVSTRPNDLNITIRVSQMPGRWGSYVAAASHPSEAYAVAFGHGRSAEKALRNLETSLGRWLAQRALASWDGKVIDHAANSKEIQRQHRERYEARTSGL